MSIAEFIAARLAEDEAVAKAAAGCGAPDWTAPDEERSTAAVRDGKGGIVVYDEGSPDEAEHIARHDPARVLREVEAKRAMLITLGAAAGSPPWDSAFSIALRCTGIAWSDHPDYREEWKP